RWKRQGFIIRIRVQRLRSSQHGGQALNGNARDVVHGLLRGKRNARSLSVETHEPRALILGAKTLLHQPVPDLARSPEFCDLFKEIIVRIKKEAQPRAELIYLEPPSPRPFHILHSVINRERQFLERRRSGFADVIPADGDSVESRSKSGSK